MLIQNYLNTIFPKKKRVDFGGIVTRALGTYIDPYHPDGHLGVITGDDIANAKYPNINPDVPFTLLPSQSPSGSLIPYTLPTKYYSDGGASIEAISPYYYYGINCSKSLLVGHASIWIKPTLTIDKTTTLQVPLLLDYTPNNDGCVYLGLGAATGLLTDEYITIVDTGYDVEPGGFRTNRRTGVTTGGALTGGQWVNICLNWDSVNSRYDIYVNNVECSGYVATTGPYSGHVKQHTMNCAQLGLGALFGDNGNGRNFFNGKISAYTQYTDSLTTQEMTTNFDYFKARFGL